MMELIDKINKLKKERNAIILAHTYQVGDIQDIADFVGDSYGLSKKAADSDADVIVFCGVHFMAETASIIAEDKTVLLPEIDAGCPMADMIDADKLRKMKEVDSDAIVVSYINSTAEVKAETDVICTSSNVLKIVGNLKTNKIIFAPDKYMGSYVAAHYPEKEIILADGYCHVHVTILPEDILSLKEAHPSAVVLTHPECQGEVVKLSDHILSTSQMLDFARESDAQEFIIATENGILYLLNKQNPQKKFYHASKYAVCPNMKKTTMEKLYWALEDMKYKIKVDKDIAVKAKRAIDNMFFYTEK
ncbi:MAG: quinolinate synthase NadA [bacterium]|nr:quinolinate synthase NadA [bacterium]